MTNPPKKIATLVKDEDLVREKRRQIVRAAVELFVHKGFHTTTTREIARAAGFSIGTLYEYIESKEDILYLVCDSIHNEIESQLRRQLAATGGHVERLEAAIAGYFRVCDELQDSILLIYRDTASLNEDSRRYVLKNETRITDIFTHLLRDGAEAGDFLADNEQDIQLMAHNIMFLGHMWCLRRWFLRDQFSIDDYIEHQTTLLMREVTDEARIES